MKADISDMSGRNRASNRALMWVDGFLLKLGEGGRLGKGGHMANHEHTPKLELDWEP